MVQAIPICRLESFAVHFGDELRAGDQLRYCTGALSAVLVNFRRRFSWPNRPPLGLMPPIFGNTWRELRSDEMAFEGSDHSENGQ